MTRFLHSRLMLVAVCALIVGAIMWSLAPLAVLYVLTDGIAALGIVLAATGLGVWITPLFDVRREWPARWHVLAGAGLGLGLLCLMVLILGSFGLLQQSVWMVILGCMGLLGVVRLALAVHRLAKNSPGTEHPEEPTPAARWLILTLMPFLALALLAATVPPGVLWSEEAHGYDVLEYHLQVPKEFFQDGHIAYLPHNIYSNFPMNAEMLYLLAMVLRDDPIEAAILSKLLNVMLGVLFVSAAWLAGRECHPSAGLPAAMIAGSTPWLMYLCGVAFVENGMLCFGMLGFACLCRSHRMRAAGRGDLALVLLSGLFAGFSCGFKYTAVPMIAGALLLGFAVLGMSKRRVASSIAGVALFAAGAFTTFAPWLTKNYVLTGNPVFPLAYQQFGAKEEVWNDDLAQHWEQGHRPAERESSLVRRLGAFKQRVLLDKRVGVLTLCLVFPLLLSRERSRLEVALFLMLILQCVMWIGWTHLYARFAVPLILPVCILAAGLFRAHRALWFRRAAGGVVLLVVSINLSSAWSIYASELMVSGTSIQVHGHTEQFYRDCDAQSSPAAYIRAKLSGDERVLMIGDAKAFYMPQNVDYCVVFNRNPFAEVVRQADSDDQIIRWLNRRGYTHLLVHHSEIRRLKRTYGFWSELDEGLFDRLKTDYLLAATTFRTERGTVYATLYEVRSLQSSAGE